MSLYSTQTVAAAPASSWPRRASKACASCRRDKIRCDGSRPCGGCKKKGYPDDQCTDGCGPCRHARVRCEEGKPCRRCVEMGLECSADNPSAATIVPSAQSSTATGATAPATSLPIKGKTRAPSTSRKTGAAGTERAKLACLNCRKDNKKCDNQRPCSRCIARTEECIHLPRGPKSVKLRCAGCKADKKKCEERRPCGYCIETNQVCVSVPRQGTGHGKRVKSACVSCRRDKIRCNGERPCTACVKKGCECVERSCQACDESGRPSQCMHRISVPPAPPPPEPIVSTADYRPLAQFNTHQSTTEMGNMNVRPQWEPPLPRPSPQSLYPIYPSGMPQEPYYLAQQTTHQPTPPAFRPFFIPQSFSNLSSQDNYYHHNLTSDDVRHYASTSASSRTLNGHPSAPDAFPRRSAR